MALLRSCTVCGHDERHAINVALVQPGASNRRIATQYGVSERAIRNQRAEHLPALLVKASAAVEVAEAEARQRLNTYSPTGAIGVLIGDDGEGSP
jgi:DNA-binding NarL/FixJ family response regulator